MFLVAGPSAYRCIPWPTPTPSRPILSTTPTLNHLDQSFKFENIKETTNKTTYTHFFVPKTSRPSNEAGPCPWWCYAELDNPPIASQLPTTLLTHSNHTIQHHSIVFAETRGSLPVLRTAGWPR